ncbi:MAG: hypothetical protein KIT09_11880 [Bryobacteraceae bacterium]|nr:hypothetical protein [Bryobacteraceae bacterium]
MSAVGFVSLALCAVAAAAEIGAPDGGENLLSVRRIYVDKLSGGEPAEQIRDMIISQLQRTGLFLVTENADRADTFLRGSAEDLIYTDTHQTSDSMDTRVGISLGSPRNSSGRLTTGRGVSVSGGAGENESQRITERKHEAVAAIRLVNKDGDVIWSTVQESRGAKFRGASADVAERITKQLLLDYDRAKRRVSPPPVDRPAAKPSASEAKGAQ